MTPTKLPLNLERENKLNDNSGSNIKCNLFCPNSERILREGRIIDEWEQPEDMFLRIVREFSRIEREAFANAAL